MVVADFKPDIKSVKDTETDWGINALIYGTSGAGKTTLIGTAADHPRGRRVLLVDIDSGARSINDNDGVDVISPLEDPMIDSTGRSGGLFNYLRQLADWLHAFDPEAAQYKTVAVDTITELQDQLLNDRQVRTKRENAPPERDDYREVKNQLVFLVRRFRQLSTRHGMNVVFTAHEGSDDANSPTANKIRPALSPSTRRGVLACLDIIGYLTIDPKTRKRQLVLEERNATDSRTRQPRYSASRLPGVIEDPTFSLLLDGLAKPSTN